MANILIKVGQSFNVPVHTYKADTKEDMNTIDLQGVPIGSKCYVINDGKWYMLNSDGKWKAMSLSSGGVQSDWNQNDDTQPDYIKNKPSIATNDDSMDFLAEMGMITPVTNSNGEILTSPSNEIYSL